jgi:hypothetical protein
MLASVLVYDMESWSLVVQTNALGIILHTVLDIGASIKSKMRLYSFGLRRKTEFTLRPTAKVKFAEPLIFGSSETRMINPYSVMVNHHHLLCLWIEVKYCSHVRNF